MFVRVRRSGFGSASYRNPRVASRPHRPARGSRAGRVESSKPAGFAGPGRVHGSYTGTIVVSRGAADRRVINDARYTAHYAAARPPSEALLEHPYLCPLPASISASKRNIYKVTRIRYRRLESLNLAPKQCASGERGCIWTAGGGWIGMVPSSGGVGSGAASPHARRLGCRRPRTKCVSARVRRRPRRRRARLRRR